MRGILNTVPTGLLVGGSSSAEKLVSLLRAQLAGAPAPGATTAAFPAPPLAAPPPADVFSARPID